MKNVWILICLMGWVTSGYGQDIGEEVKDKRVLSLKAQTPNGNVNPLDLYYYCHDSRLLTVWLDIASNIPLELSSNANPLNRFLVIGSGEIYNSTGLIYRFNSQSDLTTPIMRDMASRCEYCPHDYPVIESTKVEFDLSEFVDENQLGESDIRNAFLIDLRLELIFTSLTHYPMTALWPQSRFIGCDELWPQNCFADNTINLALNGNVPSCQDEYVYGLKRGGSRIVSSQNLDYRFENNHIRIVDNIGRIAYENKSYSGSVSELPLFSLQDKIIVYETLEEYIRRTRL